MRARRLVLALGLSLALMSCSDAPTDETPTGAVRLFVDAMQRANQDPHALEDAYHLLSRSTRRSLQERAHLAGSLGGPEFRPWEMIVAGKFRLNFAPARGSSGYRERIDGDRATVLVVSPSGGRRGRIPLVREEGRWRLVLHIPPARPS